MSWKWVIKGWQKWTSMICSSKFTSYLCSMWLGHEQITYEVFHKSCQKCFYFSSQYDSQRLRVYALNSNTKKAISFIHNFRGNNILISFWMIYNIVRIAYIDNTYAFLVTFSCSTHSESIFCGLEILINDTITQREYTTAFDTCYCA